MKRQFNTTVSGEPFDEKTIEQVWKKGIADPGFVNFKRDSLGMPMLLQKYGAGGILGWEIDHIMPVVLGGTDDITNLQPLHWEQNRAKGDTPPKDTRLLHEAMTFCQLPAPCNI